MALVQDVIMTLIQQFPRELGRTELMKLVYLADCEYFRLYGETMTNLGYWRDQRGPVDYAVVDATMDLQTQEFIKVLTYETVYGRHRIVHHLLPLGKEYSPTIEPEEMDVLGSTVEVTRGMRSDEIVAFAYDTAPMRSIMEMEEQHGDRILRGEDVPMDELRRTTPRFTMDELQAQLRKMDLTVRPMTEEAMVESRELNEAFRPYRERALNGNIKDAD